MNKLLAVHRAVVIGLTFIERDTDYDPLPRVRKIQPLLTVTHSVDGIMVRGQPAGITFVKVVMLWLALWTIFRPGAMDIWRAWSSFPGQALCQLEAVLYDVIVISPLVIWLRGLIWFNYATASC